MGPRSLLLYVLCQTVITESLGGITLSLPDYVGKVMPIKPNSLSPSSISSSSLTCDNKDILSQLLSPAPGTREFSSPLALTSSSKALPVPKIDSLSIADVKMPERLKEKFLSPKLRNAPVSNAKLHITAPDISFPYKYPLMSSSTKPPDTLPTYSSWNMYSSTIHQLPNIKSLPSVPVKSIKSSNTDVQCSSSNLNNVLTQPNISPFSRPRSLDSPLTSEVRNPLFSEQFNPKSFSPVTLLSSSYPCYYKSNYLPGVRTPSEYLNFKPTSYKAGDNNDFPTQSGTHNLINLKNLTSDSSPYSLLVKNGPYLSTYMDPIQTAENPKPNTIHKLPEIPSNVSIKPVFTAQNTANKNLWPPFEANSGSASVAFEPRFKQPEILSYPVIKDCTDPNTLRSSMPYLSADKKPVVKLKPSSPLKIKPSASPSNFLNPPATYSTLSLPSPPNTDVLSNSISDFDYSKNVNSLEMFPAKGTCVENTENCDLSCNCHTCIDPKHVTSSEQINLSSALAPELDSHHFPLFTEECITNPSMCSPSISPQYSSCFTSQTPPSISYINESTSSIAQSIANMISSIHNLVSNIVQNILSSYKSYIDTITQNVPEIPTYTFQSNPGDNLEIIPMQTLLVEPLSQGNLATSEPVPHCINPAAIETSTISPSDAPCKINLFEVSSSQPLLTSASQPTDTVFPPTSLFAFSSPQFCPSYLPSPSLPSHSTISSPFHMEPPVLKGSSSKDSDVENLIELMLLAEILNNDKNVDWDDLDMLLA